MMISHKVGVLFALVASSLVGFGCAAEEPNVLQPDVIAIGRTQQPLGVGTLLAINGTYGANCSARSGAWSAKINASAVLAHSALSVVQNDAACVLTVTSLEADQTYYASPAMLLGSAYQGGATALQPDVSGSPGPVAFYANAKVSDATFANNFVLTLLYSDDPGAVSDNVTGSYGAVTATVTATSVASPNYTVDLTTDTLTFTVDVNNLITSVSGKADLVDGSITGDHYVINVGTLAASPTFAQIDAAYLAGTPVTIAGANPKIDASSMSLVGADTSSPITRTIIVLHKTSGVSAYETIKLRFLHP